MSVATQSARSTGLFERALAGQIADDKVRVMPLPTAATELMALVASGDFSLRDVVDVVSRDQALAAYVLRYASSAGRAAREVSSIDEAVSLVGARETMSLSVALGLGSQVCGGGPLQPLKLEVWRRATFCAAFCRQLAARYQLRADEAFLAGLMANFGKAVALSCIETSLPQGGHEAMPRAFWMDVAEQYNRELGLVMVAKWQLPSFVGDVVSELTSWGGDLPRTGLARLVAIGDAVGALADSSPSINDDLLAQLPGLEKEADRDYVLGALASIAAQMWSLHGAVPDPAHTESAVALEATPLAQAVHQSLTPNGATTSSLRPDRPGCSLEAQSAEGGLRADAGATPAVRLTDNRDAARHVGRYTDGNSRAPSKIRATPEVRFVDAAPSPRTDEEPQTGPVARVEPVPSAVRVVDIPTTLRGTDDAVSKYRCSAMSKDGLVIVGQRALPLEGLVLLTLHTDPELSFFGTVARCVKNGGMHHIGVKPMTLENEQQAQWARLVGGEQSSAPDTSASMAAVRSNARPANDQVACDIPAPVVPKGAKAAGKASKLRPSVVTGAQPLVDVTRPFPAVAAPTFAADDFEPLAEPELEKPATKTAVLGAVAAGLSLLAAVTALTYWFLA